MDALDRTFRHLLNTIQARYPTYIAQPFEVSELYQNVLPYRHHRRELGLETNQEYELVLLQLLSGARDYLVVNDEMRERLARELSSPNPDPRVFREFSTSRVALSPAALRRFESGNAVAEPVLVGAGTSSTANEPAQRSASHRAPAAASSTGPRNAASSATAPASMSAQPPAPRRAASTTSSATTGPRAAASPGSASARGTQTVLPESGEQCRYCNGALPAGRRITFCPHCGQNLTVVNCLACGTELDLGWKFCTTCGRPVSPT